MGERSESVFNRIMSAVNGRVSRCDLKEIGDMVQSIMDVTGGGYNVSAVKEKVQYLEERAEKGSFTVTGMVCNTIANMPLITFLLTSKAEKDSDDYFPAPMQTDYGTGYPCAFCYSLNLAYPIYSEFGDCFFKKCGKYWYRVS